jgi:hypothetical protein
MNRVTYTIQLRNLDSTLESLSLSSFAGFGSVTVSGITKYTVRISNPVTGDNIFANR